MPIKLRDYQLTAKSDIYDQWKAGVKNVLLVLPTGMGKTKTFCSVTIDMAIDPSGPRWPTAIQVHRKELVQQISLTLAEEGIKHNIIASAGTIKGIIAAQRRLYRKQFYDFNSPVTVVSVDTLLARAKKYEEWVRKIKFWITDEAAHVLRDNKWGRAVALFPNAVGLGVTATPQRLDKKGLGRPAYGVFDVMVQGPNTRSGIEQGHLSDYRIAIPKGDYQQFLAAAKGDADYTREAMAAASSQSHIVGDVVANYEKHAAGKQAIVFASDIASAGRMERAFIDRGITAKLLTGETPDTERFQSLIDFQGRNTSVLINVDLFDEGLDVPGIECVIMARPTKSLGKYLQMIGRGLRVAEGKPFCIIIDHVGNVQEHGLPDSFRKWTLESTVRRRSKVNLMRVCENSDCNSPYDRVLTECPWCGTAAFISGRAGGTGTGRVSLQQVDGDLELLDPKTLREMYESSVLESPAQVFERVNRTQSKEIAAVNMRRQEERIATQKELAEAIALWAGKYRQWYPTNRLLNKLFYIHFEMTIAYALGEPRAKMLETLETLKEMT